MTLDQVQHVCCYNMNINVSTTENECIKVLPSPGLEPGYFHPGHVALATEFETVIRLKSQVVRVPCFAQEVFGFDSRL